MTHNKFFWLLIFILIFTSCSKDYDLEEGTSVGLMGSWTQRSVDNSVITYQKVNTLPGNDYGISFRSDHSFIERKNAGWCGTPPITYGDFSGSWTLRDSTINIRVAYWGGEAEYQWKLISLSADQLIILPLKEDYFPTVQ